MTTLYRKVSCSERLPETTKYYETEKGACKYDRFTRSFFDDDMNRVYPVYWYEPIQLPTDEEIEKMAIDVMKQGLGHFNVHGFIEGFTSALEYMEGK